MVDDLSEWIESLKSDAAATRSDFLQTAFNRVLAYADLAETEQGLGEIGAARDALRRAEAVFGKACEFLADPKHQLPDELRQS